MMGIFTVITGLMNISQSSDITDKAATVANKVYTIYDKTSIIWYSDEDHIDRFLHQFKGSTMTIAADNLLYLNDTHFHKKNIYNQTVIFANSPNEFDFIIKNINNNRTLPIYVILVIANEYEKNLIEFTEIAWNNDVSDIIIISKDADNNIIFSTYMPYSNGVCGNYSPIYLRSESKLYFMSKYKNFHKCPIRVTLLDFSPYLKLKFVNETVTEVAGIDGNLLKLLIEILNATMDIVACTDRGGFGGANSGPKAGSFNDLLNHKADIMAPAVVMASKRYEVAQISYAPDSINIVWCMPNQKEIHEWAKIVLPFFNISTPLIGAAFLIMFATIKFIKKYALLKDESKNDITFRMFKIFLGQETKFLSRYWLVNSLYASWIWLCIIVRISYQDDLIGGLQKTIVEPKITTLNEAMAVVDQVGGMSIFRDFYDNSTLHKKYVTVRLRNLRKKLNEISNGDSFLFAVDKLQVQYHRQNVQILDERVLTTPTCIHMRPRWPAASEISELIARVVETGLYRKIRRNERTEWNLMYGNLTETRKFKPIGLKTVNSCFYSLMFMYVVSTIVLLVEIYWSNRITKN
ncbi:unnamed protein product, partial [Brenthis ino]